MVNESPLKEAQRELRQRGVSTQEIDQLLMMPPDTSTLSRAAGGPYFIPNDPALCTQRSIVNCFFDDTEMAVALGFVVQPSSTRANSFARPYFINSEGVRRCRGLRALDNFSNRFSWTFDLSFVGYRGMPPDQIPCPEDPKCLRTIFLDRCQREFVARRQQWRIWFAVNNFFFFSGVKGTAEQDAVNEATRYVESVSDSRFVLCPRGNGNNSIRFFETLARCNVPVYIGDTETRFPLDWIINWDRMCVKIPSEAVLDSSYIRILDDILEWDNDQMNWRREYIFRIYHQFLAAERLSLFEYLVLLKAAHTTTSHS